MVYKQRKLNPFMLKALIQPGNTRLFSGLFAFLAHFCQPFTLNRPSWPSQPSSRHVRDFFFILSPRHAILFLGLSLALISHDQLHQEVPTLPSVRQKVPFLPSLRQKGPSLPSGLNTRIAISEN